MFEYDADGNVVAIRENGSRLSLTYDSRGRLSMVTDEQGRTTQYRYDPLGRRISKETGAGRTEFLWDQGALLSEIGPGDATIEYLFLPQTYLPVGVTAGEQHFSYVLDQAGTPTHLIDREGQIAWMGQFSAFGEALTEPINRVPNPLRFQGQYFDAETGLHYNFMRYYDPRTARYVSQDPLGTRSGANLYRYVWNPFNEVDPYGLASLANGVLTIVPICQWSDDQVKESQKKMKAMNNKLKAMGGVTIPSSPVQRCGKTAKDIYEECQKKAKQQNKPPQRNLSETNTKCTNEQADHILEICAGGGEEDCDNLQPLNESVNKSYGSQMGAVVRSNPGAVINKVQISETECTDRASLDC
jgi:RHS repeat-associated protein